MRRSDSINSTSFMISALGSSIVEGTDGEAEDESKPIEMACCSCWFDVRAVVSFDSILLASAIMFGDLNANVAGRLHPKST